jgi:DNA-binding transcriptional MerR regulator
MGRYCSDKHANPRYRQEMASYVAYQATTVPVLPGQAREARQALAVAFNPYLRQAARRIADRHRRRGDTAGGFDLQALHGEMYRKLVSVHRKAVRDFDVYWLPPHPIFPLGTLRMAWEKHRSTDHDDQMLFPERHLSFARRLAKAIEHITIDQLSEAKAEFSTVSYNEEEIEMSGSAERRGQLVREAKEEERRLLGLISRGKKTKPIADHALRARPPTEPHPEPQVVLVDGHYLACFDLRSAARKLGRSLRTLRKYDNDGRIRFVRDEDGNRRLPVDEVQRAEIVLRRSGEWAKMLGVSKETARKRLNEMPAGTDPLEMEETLLATKGDGRKRRRRRTDHPA